MITVTATITGSAPPAVLIDVVSSPTVTGEMRLDRVHDDGSRHRVLTNSRVLVGSWSGPDYHPPLNRTFSYVATAEGQASAPSPELFLPSDTTWLIDPTDPALSFPAQRIGPQDSVTYASKAAEFDVLSDPNDSGFALPVVRSDYARSGPTGRLLLRVATRDVPGLLMLFRRNSPILLNGAYGLTDLAWSWIRARDVNVANPAGHESYPTRHIEFEWRACRQPDADVKPIVTLDDIKAVGTFSQVKAKYVDLRAMKLGIGS